MTTILIVDDNTTNRELLVSLLKHSQYRVLEAGNGAEALELVRAERPALVITDILMPVMDGYEFARQVRADPELGGTPILFYSATYNQQEARALARSAGVTYVLTKPAEPQAILNMIAAALGTGPGTAQPRPDTKPLIDPVHVMSSKLAEKMGELGELHRRMAGLVELGLRVTLERDPERLLQLVCDEAREIIGAKYSAIGLLAQDGKTIRHFLTSGMDQQIIQHLGAPPVGKGLLGKLLTETRPLRIADISTDPDSVGFPPGHPSMRSFLGAPIATPAIVYGRIYLTEKMGAEEFSEQDEQLAVALAAQVAVAYENAQLYNEIQHHAVDLQLEISERKKAEAALAERERKFRALVEHSSDAIAVQALDGTVLYVSPAVEKITGIHAEAGEKVNPFARIHPDDVELSQQIWDQVIRDPLAERVVQFRIQHPNGSWRWVEAIATNLVDEPSVGGIVINFADITERKESQEEIESLANFPRENIAPVLRIARNGTLLYANPASKNLLTLWKCKVGGQPPDHVQLLVAETLVRGQSHEIEVTLGDVVDALILVPIVDKHYVNIYGRDITERKRAETALAASEELFKTAFEHSPMGMCLTGLDGTLLNVNQALADMWGFTQVELLGKQFNEFTHPQDHTIGKDVVRQMLAGQIPAVSFEKRYMHKSGEVIWAQVSSTLLRDPSGQPLHFVTQILDITQRKQAEEAVGQSEKRFRSLIENAPDGIALLGLDGKLQQITPTVRQILGYSIEESIGQDPAVLTHPDDLAELLVTLNDLIQNPGKAARAVYRFRHKDGSWRWLESTISNLIAEPGVNAIVFNYRDITERKQAEEALRAGEEKFRQLAETIDEVFWVSDPPRDKMIYVSPAYERVWGRTSQSVYDQPRAFIKLVHPDDQERVITTLLLQKSGQPFSQEYRILKPDGSIRWIWDRGFPVRDWDASILRYVGVTQDITERKVAESALQEREARLQAVVENVGGTLWSIDARCQLTMFNSTYADVLRSHLGHETQLGETLPPEWLPRQEREEWKIRYLRALSGEAFQEEVTAKLDSGVQLHREYSFNPITDPSGRVIGVTCFGRDITERKHAQERIQRQLKHLSALRLIDLAISSSFDLQITLDVVLQQIHSQLGVDASAVLLFDPQLRTLEYAASRGFDSDALRYTQLSISQGHAVQAVLERKTIHISGFMERGDKLVNAPDPAETEFADYYAVPLFIKGEVKAVLEIYYRTPLTNEAEWVQFLEMLAGQAAIAIDNAQLFETLQRSNQELELRVTDRTAELNKTNAELERANRVKDEFLANMSHELRTPLNSILGLSESLLEGRRGSLNDHQQRYLRMIESSGQHLLELINDILDLSKIEAGMLEFFPQPISVTEFCNSCLAFVSAQAARKSISVTLTNEATNPKLFADPRRLKQILVNLLTNAVKFSQENGHVSLEVSDDAERDLIRFSVSDDGIGISAENLKRLFHPFVQVDSNLNRQYEGTGLGLALVQRLTDLHGGSVSVQSEPGRGSCFTIHLPCRQDRLKELEQIQPVFIPAAPPERQEVSSAVPMRQHLILLAEDQAANILTIGEYLDSHGFEVIVAHDGLEAIERAHATRPDLILMDIQMPVLDGLEAMTRLRRDPDFASTPIIAVTALAMPGDRERCLEAGADEYMSKPVSLKSLRQMIEYFLQSK